MSTLKEDIAAMFAQGLADCGAHGELGELAATLAQAQWAIGQPMRVALVGKTNAGKSTMLNAFLGEELAPTGNGELTFNVCWFRHAARKHLRVHTVDGATEDQDFDSLAQLAARCERDRHLLERIRYLEVFCPNPLLETFDLIDTPGLHSFYVKDSRNTTELLTSPQSRPHALVFLFSGALQQPDVDELERFHAACGSVMSGITAIGALTKVDESPNGFADGLRSIEQLSVQHPVVRRYFYAIEPVVGPAAFGAQTLTAADHATLQQLAALDDAVVQKLLLDVNRFCTREYPPETAIPGVADRARLFERLGRYGVRTGVALLRGGVARDALADVLLQRTGVDRLRTIVTAHFGGRAFLIKARSALSLVREQAFGLGERLRGPAALAAQGIAARVDAIVANELRFREFGVLERHYAGALPFDDKGVRELLRVTGEDGPDCWARLGAARDLPLERLQAIAQDRERAWRTRALDAFEGLHLQEAARVVADSYAEIRHRLATASEHLQIANHLLAYRL